MLTVWTRGFTSESAAHPSLLAQYSWAPGFPALEQTDAVPARETLARQVPPPRERHLRIVS